MSDVKRANALRAESIRASFINRSLIALIATAAALWLLATLSGVPVIASAHAGVPCPPTYAETGAADDVHYAFGETAQITGAGFAPSCDVSVQITRPDGQVEVGAVTTDATGSFAFSYALQSLAGDYVVSFLGQDGAELMGIGFSNGPVVMLDKGDVRDGDSVHMSGTAYAPLSTVIVQVIRPDNSIVKSDGTPGSDSVAVDSIGDFAYDYVVRDGVMADYLVDVLDPQGKVLAQTSFTDSAAFVKNIGTFSSGNSLTSLTVTLGAGVSVNAGNSIIVGVSWAGTSGSASCSDSAGNSYAVDATAVRPGNGSVSILSAHNVGGLVAGNTITCTIPTGVERAMSANEFSGLVASSTLDKTHTGNGNSNNPNSGATTMTSQGDELLFGAVYFGRGATFVPGIGCGSSSSASYSTINNFFGSGSTRLGTEYAIATATGTYAACVTVNPSQVGQWAAAIATYKISTVKDTTTTVSSSLNPSHYGDPVTFTAAVTAGATAVTTGSVTFIEGGTCDAPSTTLSGPTGLGGSGQATFMTSALALGDHTIVACYGGATGLFSTSNGSVTQSISTRLVTVTADAQTKTYGDPDPAPLTYKITSGTLVGTDSFSGELTRVAGENVGTYAILQGALALNSNYSLTYVGADLTIKKKDATWTTNPASKTYGDSDPIPLTTGSGSGFLESDNVTATYTRAGGETVAGGPYHITAALSPAGVLGNYNITNNGAAFTINRRNATWMTNAASKTYGDPDPVPLTTGSGSNFVSADGVTATYFRAAGEMVVGSPYHITAMLITGVAGALDNYSITNVGATFTINPRPITVTADAKAKFIGNPDPPLTVSTSNILGFSDTLAGIVSGAVIRDPGDEVGTYTIRRGTLAVNANYALTFVEGSFYIVSLTVAGPTEPLSKGTVANLSASFPNTGTQSGPSCTVDWNDGGATSSAPMTLSGANWVCTLPHTYAAAGVYAPTVTVMDGNTGTTYGVYKYIVVYDPGAGFVTGGGWIMSPVGAYVADPSLTGKANFGFVSKYLKGATVPTGDTQFQFQTGNLNFKSKIYQWLVISGPKAQYKGSGTINGAGDYGFLLTAVDGSSNGGGGSDKFRIKIWDNNNNGAIVYDNQIGADDTANPTTTLGGGSIVIHN
jgi:MBG domain-containing protein/Big-like domain-containing protein